MVIFKLLTVVFVLLMVVVVVSQIIIPAFTNRALFPMFREQSTLEAEIAELNQQKVESELAAHVKSLKEDAAKSEETVSVVSEPKEGN